MASLDDVLKRLCEPIAGASPVGADLSFDAEFEAVADQITRLERVDGPRTDWGVVEASAERLLAERTKDLRLVAWGTAARVHNSGWEGLAVGLSIYAENVRRFWKEMFPPVRRLRARANAHDWLVEHVAPMFEEREVAREERDAVILAAKAIDELDALFADGYGGDAPSTARLRTIVRRRMQDFPATLGAAPPQAPSETDRPALAASSPGVVGVGDGLRAPALPTNADGARGAIARSIGALNAAASVLIDEDPSDAGAYSARRMAAALSEPGPLQSPTTRERLFELAGKQAWFDLLREGEAAVLAFPTWLDAHWCVAEAMAHLGPRFVMARRVVEAEALSLAGRSPALFSAQFPDGTPMAAARTVAWLQDELRRASGASTLISVDDSEAERRVAEVHRMASDGGAHEAVALAIGLANRAGDPRGRFRGQLLACRVAIDAGQFAVARPLLEGLLALTTKHDLEAWEPRLCVELYGSYLACLRAAGPEGAQPSRDIFDKLCKLDPAAAMRVAPPVAE